MKYVNELIERYPALAAVKEPLADAILAVDRMALTGRKLLLCGNGGSAADCEHISGELLKGFLKKRPYKESELPGLDPAVKDKLQKSIPAIPLTSLSASLTAFANDVDPALSYAQLVQALGQKGDVLIGLSTSGNAKNVCFAAETARALGMTVIALTGAGGGRLATLADIAIRVPETETFKIQELHLPVYHALCAQCEEDLFR